MSSARGLRSGPNVHTVVTARYLEPVLLGNGRPPTTAFVCGFLGCDLRPFNPLLAALPHLMHMRGMSSAWLSSFTRQVTEESQLRRAGADSVLTRLAELMFIEVLRRYLEEQSAGQTGWLAGLRDEVVGRVLGLLSTPILAIPGLSTSWLDTPLHPAPMSPSDSPSWWASRRCQYLTQWRMQVAANLLAQSGAKIAAVGAEVELRLRGGVQPRVQAGDRDCSTVHGRRGVSKPSRVSSLSQQRQA